MASIVGSSRETASGRTRGGARLAFSVVALAALALSGCSSAAPTPKVTITVAPPAASAAPTPAATPQVTPEATPNVTPPAPKPTPAPDPIASPAPTLPAGVTLVVTQGAVAPECTHTVCYYVHLTWTGLDTGNHQVQCTSSLDTVGVFSDNSLRFDTGSGERDLKCFLGHPGSKVWVLIDGTLESNHAPWA